MSTDEQTGTALATQQQQEQMGTRPGILQPIASAADLVRAAKLHEQVRDALMTRDDYQVVRTKKGEQSFPISSYFNKIAVAYGASTVIKPGFPILHYGDDGQLLRAECIVIATIGGRTEEAYGACSIEEERFKNAQGAAKSFHDLPATSQCVPLRAEMLTIEGWKRPDQLRVGELVLAYDPAADQTTWTALQDVQVFEGQPTVVLESQGFRAECTQDHSWAVSMQGTRVRTPQRRLIPTDRLRQGQRIVLAAPCPSGTESDLLAPEEASILGWIVTDGHVRFASWSGPRVHIDQSKPEGIEELRALLGSNATESVAQTPPRTFPTGRTYPVRPAHRFTLRIEASRRLLEKARIADEEDIPRLIPHLTPACRRAMLSAMLHGDGNRHGSTWVFSQRPGPVLDAFHILCALEGIATGRAMQQDVCVRHLLKVHAVADVGAFRRSVGPVQTVWCPTTHYGTWVMRLDGQVMITGNTRARNRALGQMFGYGKQQPSWEEVEGSPDDPRRQDTPPQGTGTGRTPATSSRMNGKANTQPTASEGAQQALVDLGKSLAAIENGLEGAERHNEWDYIWGKAARTLGIKTRRLADLTVREAEQIGEELRRLAGTLNAPDDEVTDAEFSVATDDAETSEAQQGSLVADEI